MISCLQFEETLLPGNYALTKSMELTKINSSGTLWYIKKYIVLYYYIFLSRDIYTDEYVRKVISSFDRYIESLDESIKKKAEEFFYPNDDAINFKSLKFKKFRRFACENAFSNADEERSYFQNAKKCYFALLMGTGGQSGIKEKVIQEIKKEGFYYTSSNIKNIIMNATICVCTEEANNGEVFHKGDVARIISKKAVEEINRIIKNRKIKRDEVSEIINNYPCSEEYPGEYGSNSNLLSPQILGVENDCFASVRNERQILYYYGYFHSKSSGATDMEASSLTPIGELSLDANSQEFLAIWEHQKIKMLSQPPTTDINNLPSKVNNIDKFAISFKPYMDILEYLYRNDIMSLDVYKYIVSRKKHIIQDSEWDSIEKMLANNIESIKSRVRGFGRDRDTKDEDGRKELLKYLLGIRDDLPFDNKTNVFNICSMNRNLILKDRKTLGTIIRIYKHANTYKIQKFKDMFLECEEDLKQRYISGINGDGRKITRSVKLHWDLYNIYPDKYILLCVSIAIACVKLKIENVENASKEDLIRISEIIRNDFKSLFEKMGMKSDSSITNEISSAIVAMREQNYQKYIEIEYDNSEVLAQYKDDASLDIITKINDISKETTVSITGDRTRNTRLIGLIKSYYMSSYLKNNTLKCESCGNETFITKAGEPYVEFHHLIPFNIAYGPDHYLNIFALCPVCHRKIHFQKEEDKKVLYDNLNNNNYLDKRLVERLKELNNENLLKTYHLDYLLNDNAITLEDYDDLYIQLIA